MPSPACLTGASSWTSSIALCGTCVLAAANESPRFGGLFVGRRPGGTRRLLILGYSPTWMKQIDRPGAGLTAGLLENADRETRELLGRTGWY